MKYAVLFFIVGILALAYVVIIPGDQLVVGLLGGAATGCGLVNMIRRVN